MSKFFSPDNAFFTGLNKIIDVIWISLIWSVFCLPLFWFLLLTTGAALEDIESVLFLEILVKAILMGPSTTALYYTMIKVIRRERGYATKQFFQCFKRNFKYGGLVSLTYVGFAYLMYIDFQFVNYLKTEGKSGATFMFVVFACACVFAFFVLVWIFPILSRFEVKYVGLFKNAFLVSIRHFLRTLMLVALLVASMYLVMAFLPVQFYILFPFIYPGLIALLSTYIVEPVLKKYISEPEGTPEETGVDQWYRE